MTASRARPPSPLWLLVEGRAVYELGATYLLRSLLDRGPRGDGHPVLVLPGLAASDLSTRPLRRFLARRGFHPERWDLGRNIGPTPDLEPGLHARLAELHQQHDRRVSLLGWSLGGVYARLLAAREPEQVRCVVTMGSPFADDPKANHSWRLLEWLSGTRIDDVEPHTMSQIRSRLEVPCTAIYSRTDGVTAWRCCVVEDGPQAENIEVRGSHCGLGFNPLVLHAVADRLAQPEGAWQRFRRTGLRRHFYRRPPVISATAATVG